MSKKLVVDAEWLETVMDVAGGVRLVTIDHLHCGAVAPDDCGNYKSCTQCLIENSNGAVRPLTEAQERAEKKRYGYEELRRNLK